MAFWKDENMIEKKDPGRDQCEGDPHENGVQEEEELEELEELNELNELNELEEEEEEEEEEDVLNVNEEEINSLNHQLDELNSALDKLEERNDDLHAQLEMLLEANKAAREQFFQIRTENCNTDDKNHNS